MKKGTFLATLALLIAIAGAIVAFAAYFKRRTCTLCDDFEDDLQEDDLSDLDYYATQVDEDDDEEQEDEAAAPEASAPAPAEAEEETPEESEDLQS